MAVQHDRALRRSLGDMNDADDYRREARPATALCRVVDVPAILTNRKQASDASIALTNRVGRDEAERAVRAEENVRSPKEVSGEVGITTCPRVKTSKPITEDFSCLGANTLSP